MSFDRSIDKETINELPLKVFEGPIHIIDDPEKIKNVLPAIAGCRFLGFDTETRPSFKKGKKNKVALLQLATPQESFLFRINKIGLPKELRKILADPDIIKVGAAIHDDIKSLQKIKSFNPGGFADLQNLVRDFGIESLSLKKLAAIVLNFRISKSQQLTNWDAGELSEAQQKYAAMDAWVALQIFLELRKEVNYSDKILADVIK
jgi:ribonuclease D